MSNERDDVWADVEKDVIPRDRWGRPMVVPPDGKKAVAYTRVTTYAGSVEDTYGLQKWYQRMVAIGLTKRPDLLLSVSAHADDKDEVDRIVDQAREAAAASAAANTGTALHRLAERYDRGQLDLTDVPASHRADLAAYADAMRPFTICGIEQFVVIDVLQIGGTFDRILEHDGQRYVADIKTGSIEYGAGKMAVQLALYAHGELYTPGQQDRAPLDVSTTAGIIIHLPAGQARCDLYWIDLKAGWRAVDLCDNVRQWRKRKDLLAPAKFADPVAVVADTFPGAEVVTDLAGLIGAASDETGLLELWSAHRDEWTAEHTRLATARKTYFHQQALRDAVAAS